MIIKNHFNRGGKKLGRITHTSSRLGHCSFFWGAFVNNNPRKPKVGFQSNNRTDVNLSFKALPTCSCVEGSRHLLWGRSHSELGARQWHIFRHFQYYHRLCHTDVSYVRHHHLPMFIINTSPNRHHPGVPLLPSERLGWHLALLEPKLSHHGDHQLQYPQLSSWKTRCHMYLQGLQHPMYQPHLSKCQFPPNTT